MAYAIKVSRIVALTVAFVCQFGLSTAWSQEPDLQTFFHNFVGLSDDQTRDIRAGKAVAKVLQTPTPDEVFIFGAVYINSTPERYLQMASDVEALRRLPN